MTKIIENMNIEEWIETLIEELKVEYVMMNGLPDGGVFRTVTLPMGDRGNLYLVMHGDKYAGTVLHYLDDVVRSVYLAEGDGAVVN